MPQGAAGPKDTWVQPALVSAVASLLVLFRIGSFGLWADEGFSISTSLRPWGELAHLTVHGETNGAMYAFLLKAWAVGGLSETWLRFPSAVSFVATVSLTWVLGRRLHGHVAGAIAAVLVTLHGTLIQYGQNIRYYAPVAALAVGFAVAVHRLLERQSRGRSVAVLVLAILLPLFHLVATTMLIGAAVLFLLAGEPKVCFRRLLLLVPGGMAGLGVAALVSSRDEGQSINQELGVSAVKEVVLALTGSGGAFGAFGYGLLLLTGAVMLPAAVRRCRSRGRRALDAMSPWVFVGSTMACVIVGSVVTPLMVGRYVLFLAPFLALCAAVGLVTAAATVDTSGDNANRRLGGMVLPAASPAPWGALRLLSVGGLGLVVLLGGLGATSGAFSWVTANDREDWKPVVSTLLDKAGPEDAVLFANDSTRLFVEYQLRRDPALRERAPVPFYPSGGWGEYRTGDQRYEAFSVEQVDAALRRHEVVWLVVERPLVEAPVVNLVSLFSARPPAETVYAGRAATLYRLDGSVTPAG